MTQDAWPFNDRLAYEAEWREMARLWRATGILAGEGDELDVEQRAAGPALSVDVQTGNAWITGHYFENDAVVEVAVPAPAANPRIDTIVVEYDFIAGTRTIKRVAGAEAAVPVSPALTLTQNRTTKYQFPLRDIYCRVGMVSVKTADDAVNGYLSTDRRTYSLAPFTAAGGTFTGDVQVPDEAYGVGWNGSLETPTKNAVYDKIESLPAGVTEFVIPAKAMEPHVAGPNFADASGGNGLMGWMLDAASAGEYVGGILVKLPADWNTFALDALLVRQSVTDASIGARIYWTRRQFDPAGGTLSNTVDASSQGTVNVQDRYKVGVHTLFTGVAVTPAAAFCNVVIGRIGSDGTDTLPGDLALVGARIRKVT